MKLTKVSGDRYAAHVVDVATLQSIGDRYAAAQTFAIGVLAIDR